jgi:hypothetical protein
MQSEMKKVTRPIAAAKYDILPTDVYDDNKYGEYVCSQVQDLLDGGNFLHNGVDKQVHLHKIPLHLLIFSIREGPTTSRMVHSESSAVHFST